MMDMTFTQAAVIADELAAQMVEKGLKTPDSWLHVQSGGRCKVWLNWSNPNENYRSSGEILSGETIQDAIAKARAWIAALPSPMTKALNNHMSGIAKLVDAGRAAGIDDAYIAPLVVVKAAISNNLLAAPVAS